MSSNALEALKEFYADRDELQKKFETLKAQAEDGAQQAEPLSMEAFQEDWNASQFWVSLLHTSGATAKGSFQYSNDTATSLACQLLQDADKETVIAVVSAPSVFIQLKNQLVSSERYATHQDLKRRQSYHNLFRKNNIHRSTFWSSIRGSRFFQSFNSMTSMLP